MGFSRQEYWSGVLVEKTIALPRWTIVGKVMSLLFNVLSAAATAAAKSLQSCPTLCDPTEGSPPGSAVPKVKRREQVLTGPIRPALPHFPGGSEVKVPSCNVGDPGSIPGLGRSPGEGNGNPLQYSCLENPRDRGA